MSSVYDLKELECPGTPLFLFDCTLANGDVQRWSTHTVSPDGNRYQARILDHNLFELQNSTKDAIGTSENLRVVLADADAVMSEIEQNTGWKGAQLLVTFLFFDLIAGAAAADSIVVFRGTCNPVDEATEETLHLSFVSRLNLQRSYLPTIRVQRRCPWAFPSNAGQLHEAVDGGSETTYSRFFSCGYSAGVVGGSGNLNGQAPFSDCDYTRIRCQERGMFDRDSTGQITRRFGGIEFVPPSIQVRSYGERGRHTSPLLDNVAVYNDLAPLVYGTGWFQPPVVFARNDGNLTRMEVLLGAGQIDSVVKVVVNGVEIPAGVSGSSMTATGWYTLMSAGARSGAFNTDFSDGSGNPLGDPYGSMAYTSIAVPNGISDGRSLPDVNVLVRGLKLPRYDTSGALVDASFSNNPAWVLLDVLRRAGWRLSEFDLASFSQASASCDQLIDAVDLQGNPTQIKRCQCNLIITKRRSVGDLVRGISNGSGILLRLGENGLLQASPLGAIATQQPARPAGSNAIATIAGGWPAYEFGDNSLSGIARRTDGSASIRVLSQPISETPNRLTIEFQDEFNDFQQDSLSLSDIDDVLLINQELTVPLQALGLPNFNQAARMLARSLNLVVNGNTHVQFETSVRAAGLRPGDLISLTYSREAWDRKLFRITAIAPTLNFRRALITAQIHDDAWFGDQAYVGSPVGGRQSDSGTGLPRPLLGTVLNSDGTTSYGISEQQQERSDGTVATVLTVQYATPARPLASAAGIPLVGLAAQLSTSGGTLAGGGTYYYALSAVDSSGNESPLSFIVTASIPPGGNTNAVDLVSLSFSPATRSFNVYRGEIPEGLSRIAPNQAIASTFADAGLTATATPPPDQNYDHANFYWRLQVQPETPATQFSPTTIGNSTLKMTSGQYAGMIVRITKGTGRSQEQVVATNTDQLMTTVTAWDVAPDSTSVFAVVQAGWSIGGTTRTGKLQFQTPTEPGSTIEICGRAANVRNQECGLDVSPITEWQLGMGGGGQDMDTPPAPVFGIVSTGGGGIEVTGVGFNTLVNTATITSCTLELVYWNELNGRPTTQLAAGLDGASSSCNVASTAGFTKDDLLQIDQEILQIRATPGNDGVLQVARDILGSAAASHVAGAHVYRLDRRTCVLPFPRRFFGSSASGSYVNRIDLPSVRVAGAECFATNTIGDGLVQDTCYTNSSDSGLRTLSGGQVCFQAAGGVAVQNDAAPRIQVDHPRSIADVLATVTIAPSGGDIIVAATRNEKEICRMVISDGATSSDAVDGFELGSSEAGDSMGINVISVPAGAATTPGRDLSVTIRF